MIELKLTGDFSAEIIDGAEYRQIVADGGVEVTSFWDADVPLTLTLGVQSDAGGGELSGVVGPTIAIVGHEEIDALRRHCEMILEHYKIGMDEWRSKQG